MRIRRSIRLAVHFLALCLAGHRSLAAQNQSIRQMIHTAWTARDGAPQNINSIAQTPDGTLWLGTSDGLYSFDGLTFSLFEPVSGSFPRHNVQTLFAATNGDLWAVGPALTAVRIREGVATVFARVENSNFESLGYVQESSDGTIWAILNSSKLVRLGGDGIWHIAPGASPNSLAINSFFIDSSDTQWLAADNVLYRRPRGQEAFTSTGVLLFGPGKFEEAPDHTLWIGGYGQLGLNRLRAAAGQQPVVALNHIDASGKRLPNPLVEAAEPTVASDGSLWVSYGTGGLQRLRSGEMKGIVVKEEANSLDTFGESDGLTNSSDRKLFRDRDGNIWSFGTRGIDRFQHATMVAAVPAAMSGWWSVCIAPAGDIWLSLYEGFLGVVRNHRFIRLKDRTDRPVEVGYSGTYSLECDKNSDVWLLGSGGIGEARNNRVKKLPLLPKQGNYYDSYFFTSLAVLPDHRLLASTDGPTENRLWTYENGVWKVFLPPSGITHIGTLWQDARNNLYLGSTSGQIIVLEPPGYHVISTESSDIGPVIGFSETSYGIFAFGKSGLALRQNGKFRALSFADPAFSVGVTGLAEDQAQDIWVNGLRAILRISSAEISMAASDPSHHIQAREFHEGEYRGSDSPYYSRNSAQIDSEGRIWFPTSNGVIYIDPRNVDRPSRPPTLSIRSITADGRPIPADGNFPPHIETLDVRYFGLNLSDPTGVVYRYKLDRYDMNWQDVGTRTEAVYTHLRPGKYVFEVEASNGNGVWTAPFHSVPFRILPSFYQTWWFEALCFAFGIVVLWLGITARVRFITVAVRIRAEERAEERVRIARELHDTLLQGVQGLLMNFHAAAQRVPAGHESKTALDRALALADRVILEGRDRVNRLRSEHFRGTELAPAIREMAEDLAAMSTLEFEFEETGMRRPLNPSVLDETYYITKEALTNSYRHSGASKVTVVLNYGEHEFSLECRDNGRGFDKGQLEECEIKGHWGFRGMAERAERIGADFDFDSAPGEGVRICINIPAAQAYIVNLGSRSFIRRFNRFPGTVSSSRESRKDGDR